MTTGAAGGGIRTAIRSGSGRGGSFPGGRPGTQSETEFMAQVTELAELCGWAWVHFRPAQTERGWRTPVSGPLGKGWVDLVMVRVKDRRLIFAELKGDKGKVTAEQAAVLAALEELTTAKVETHVWRPADFDRIVEILR